MVRPGLVVAAVVTAVLLRSEIATAQTLPVRDTLDNGLEVIVVENHVVPLATVLVAVRNGSFVQAPGEEGLAHLFEHVVFRGYGRSLTEFQSDVARLNGTYNGGTSEEVVTYYIMAPSAKAADAVEILARALTGVHFEARDLTSERAIILDELGRDEADPEGALQRRVARQLWGDAWHRKDVGGDSSSLGGISLQRLRQVYQRYYRPNNAALIVTGDVSAAAVMDVARRRFDDWKAGADSLVRREPPPPSPLAGTRAVVVDGRVLDVTVLIALRGPGLRTDTAATYAADVLFEALNTTTSSLQQRLVDSGLFQSLYFSYRTLNEPGPILIHAKTTNGRAIEALTALLAELDQMERLPGLSQQDLAVGAKRREVAAALDWEQTAALAPGLASWWAAGGIEYYLGYRQRTEAVGLDDLRAFVQKYITGAPRVIGVLGAPSVTARVAEWLQGQGVPRP